MPTQHCGDPNPHKPHTFYGPNPDPKKTTQVQYNCPGTSSYVPKKRRK